MKKDKEERRKKKEERRKKKEERRKKKEERRKKKEEESGPSGPHGKSWAKGPHNLPPEVTTHTPPPL
jgi:hypothetical protein